MLRVGGDEGVADLADRGDRVRRVVPPVRVEAGGLGTGGLAGSLDRHPGAEVDHGRLPARLGDHLAHPLVEVVAVLEHELRAGGRLDVGGPRLVLVRVGVGLEDLGHVRVGSGDRARPVADLGRGRDDRQPARRGVARPAAGEQQQRGGRRQRAVGPTGRRSRTAATTAKTAPASTEIAAPGGTFHSTDSQSPTTPSPATSATEPSCQGRSRRVTSLTVAAGTTKSAVTSSAPIAGSAETTPARSATSRIASGTAERIPSALALPASNPIASQRRPSAQARSEHDRARERREHEVARPDQEQAAEEQ